MAGGAVIAVIVAFIAFPRGGSGYSYAPAPAVLFAVLSLAASPVAYLLSFVAFTCSAGNSKPIIRCMIASYCTVLILATAFSIALRLHWKANGITP